MSWLAAKLGGRGAAWAVVALLAVALLSLAYCNGRHDGKSGEQLGAAKREAEVRKYIGNADTSAADARVKDSITATRQEQELDAAIKATGSPDEQRALRGCVIMRQQGRDTSGIPACGGPAR